MDEGQQEEIQEDIDKKTILEIQNTEETRKENLKKYIIFSYISELCCHLLASFLN